MSLNLISQNNSKTNNNNSISLITLILGFLNRFNWKKQNVKGNKSPRWYFRMIARFF